MKLHSAVIHALVDSGVDVMFGLMGDGNMMLIADFIHDHAGQYVAAVHESGAIAMSDGFSRATNRVGVATVTHGPGVTNSLTALTQAVRCRSRVLLMTGDPPSRRDSLQSLDLTSAVAATGAGYERIYSPKTAVEDTVKAYRRVILEQRPVVLNVPADLLDSEIDYQRIPISLSEPGAIDADPELLNEALGLIASARRPVILAGHGAVVANARDDLVELSDLLGAPLATTVLAKDFFRGHPYNLGTCGIISSPLASETISKADCIIAFGASLNPYTAGVTTQREDSGGLLLGKRIIQCDIDPRRLGEHLPIEVGLTGDAKVVAKSMTRILKTTDLTPSAFLRQPLARAIANESPFDGFADKSDDQTVDLRTALIELDSLLPKDRVVVTDSGHFMLAPWKYLHVSHPSDFLHSVSFGSIGLGLGIAIGAAVGKPSQLTVVVVGDGGFMMSCGEFTTAVRNRLPLLVVVANDGGYGAEYWKLKARGFDPSYALFDWPDLTCVAESFGGHGACIRSLDQLKELANRLDGLTGPFLLDLKLNPPTDFVADE